MKKAIVLLLALCLTGIAFAEGETWTIEGDASVTWGYNLNDDSHGFINDASFTLTIPLVAETTKATEGLEGVYGWIEFDGFEALVEGDTEEGEISYSAPSISAKIIAGALWVGIYSEPSFGYNMATMFEPASVDAWEDASWQSETAATRTIGGITVGYDTEMVKFALNIGSDGNYEGATGSAGTTTITPVYYVAPAGVTETVAANAYLTLAGVAVAAGSDLTDGTAYWQLVTTTTGATDAELTNTDPHYMIGADITIVPMEMLEVVVGFFADLWDAADGANKGVGVGLTVKPMEGVEIGAGLDVVIAGELDAVMDISLAATYTMANKDSATLSVYFVPATENTVGADIYHTQDKDTSVLNLGFKVSEDTAEGFVPGLGASAYVNAIHLLDEENPLMEGMPVLLGASAEYEYAIEEGKTVKPYAAFDYGLYGLKGSDTDNGLHFKVGCDINVIAKTTFNVQFEAGTLADDEYLFVTPVFGSDAGMDKGLFTVSCTIEY